MNRVQLFIELLILLIFVIVALIFFFKYINIEVKRIYQNHVKHQQEEEMKKELFKDMDKTRNKFIDGESVE